MKNDPLKNHHIAVVRAEAALAKARDKLTAAAKREGVPIAGIFSESRFVWRTTAERWSFEAERKGERTMSKILVSTIKGMRDPSSYRGPFAHLAAHVVEQPAVPAPTGKLALVVDNATTKVSDKPPNRDLSARPL